MPSPSRRRRRAFFSMLSPQAFALLSVPCVDCCFLRRHFFSPGNISSGVFCSWNGRFKRKTKKSCRNEVMASRRSCASPLARIRRRLWNRNRYIIPVAATVASPWRRLLFTLLMPIRSLSMTMLMMALHLRLICCHCSTFYAIRPIFFAHVLASSDRCHARQRSNHDVGKASWSFDSLQTSMKHFQCGFHWNGGGGSNHSRSSCSA